METTVILRPIANGDLSLIYPRCTSFPGGSQNWQNVDEAAPDDFSTYNYHAGAGTGETAYSYNKIDNFWFEPLPSNIAPTKVGLRMRARRTTGNGTAISQLLIGGLEYFGTAVPFFGSNQWTEGYAEWLLNPANGQPWTYSVVAGMQGGYRLPISLSYGTTFVYCTQFQMEVTGTIVPIWPAALPVLTEDYSVLRTELLE